MTLDKFLQGIDEQQTQEYSKLTLFNSEATRQWNEEQRKHFVRVFYHTRGHFDRLLWTRLVHAPTARDKKMILHYMAQEAGLVDLYGDDNLDSHEILFGVFSQEMGVDLTPELTEREGYLPFARDFNDGLVHWFRTHDWESGQVAFAAYERLDNIDYGFMYDLAVNLGVSARALTFFEVHRQADHFEQASGELPEVWEQDQKKVMEAFNFIYGHQRVMWKGLSDACSEYDSSAKPL